MKEDCPFCDLKKIKGDVLDYGDVFAFTPLNPVVEGHLLVCPRAHVCDFTKDYVISGRTMEVAAQIAKARGGHFNLITSRGESATQSVMHLHIHLVPRKENDGLHLPWTNQKI